MEKLPKGYTLIQIGDKFYTLSLKFTVNNLEDLKYVLDNNKVLVTKEGE